jgi:hypothetical protein
MDADTKDASLRFATADPIDKQGLAFVVEFEEPVF